VAKLTTQLSHVLTFFYLDIDAVCNDGSSHHDDERSEQPAEEKASMENHLRATANQVKSVNEAIVHQYPAKSFVDVIL